MAFQADAFQNNAFQIISEIINNIKLIFKNPNDKPFKTSSVSFGFDNSEVRLFAFKGTKCYMTLINPDNNIT